MTNDCQIVAPKSRNLEDVANIGRDADVLLGWRVPQRMVDEAKRAKMIQIIATGAVDFDPGGLDKRVPLAISQGKRHTGGQHKRLEGREATSTTPQSQNRVSPSSSLSRRE
jgi:phosphoglycerate dehydrogenase-like enzyme